MYLALNPESYPKLAYNVELVHLVQLSWTYLECSLRQPKNKNTKNYKAQNMLTLEFLFFTTDTFNIEHKMLLN